MKVFSNDSGFLDKASGQDAESVEPQPSSLYVRISTAATRHGALDGRAELLLGLGQFLWKHVELNLRCRNNMEAFASFTLQLKPMLTKPGHQAPAETSKILWIRRLLRGWFLYRFDMLHLNILPARQRRSSFMILISIINIMNDDTPLTFSCQALFNLPFQPLFYVIEKTVPLYPCLNLDRVRIHP